jgi:multiple antibiotic resistance protein
MNTPLLGPAEIFTILFVTLGPLKVLGPFLQRTHDIPEAALHQIAIRGFVIATVAIIVGGFLGTFLMSNWHVSFPALTLSAGVIFFLIALRQLMEQYLTQPAATAQSGPLPPAPLAAATRLVFPIILPPYGIAAVMALLARSPDAGRTLTIVAILIGIMILDLLAMWFTRRILVGFIPLVLQVVGAVLAVLQVALSVEFMLLGLRSLHVIS